MVVYGQVPRIEHQVMQCNISPIDLVPQEIIAQIFSYFDPRNLNLVACICKKWRRISSNAERWKSLYSENWPLEWKDETKSWKESFVFLKQSPLNLTYLDNKYFVRGTHTFIHISNHQTLEYNNFETNFDVKKIKRRENLIGFIGEKQIAVWDLHQGLFIFRLSTINKIFKKFCLTTEWLVFGEAVTSKEDCKNYNIYIYNMQKGNLLNSCKNIANLSFLKLSDEFLHYHSNDKETTWCLTNNLIWDKLKVKSYSVYGQSFLARVAKQDCEIEIIQMTINEDIKRHVLKGHSAPISLLKFIKGKDRLVSVSKDGTINYWNYKKSDHSINRLTFKHENCFKIASCVKTNQIATLNPTKIKIWHLLAPEPLCSMTIDKPFDDVKEFDALKLKLLDDYLIVMFNNKIKSWPVQKFL